MRKITLLFAFLAFAGMTFAQTCDLNGGVTPEKAKANVETKAFGDVIWSEDFDGDKWKSSVSVDGNGYEWDGIAELPEGWTVVDNNERDFFWHWSDVGPRGRYTSGEDGDAFTPDNSIIESLPDGTTVENGFLMLESDYFNTTDAGEMVGEPVDMDAYMQYGPIDFSANPYVIFNVKTIYRYCCQTTATMGLELSSDYNPADGSGTWTFINLNEITNGNDWTDASERDNHINVTKIVGGESAVYFRIRQSLASHYCWLVDDISFYEAPVNDIQLNDGFADYIYNAEYSDADNDYNVDGSGSFNFWGGYTAIPQSIVGDFVQFRAAVFNNGVDDATNSILTAKVFKGDVLDATYTSDARTLYSSYPDTLKVTADYTPADVAHYQVSLTIDMDADDENSADNGYGYEFDVTDGEAYSRVRHGEESTFGASGPRDWASGGNEGDICVQRFTFPESAGNVTVKGLQVYIDDYDFSGSDDEIEAIKNGEFTMIARVYHVENDERVEFIASNLYTIQIADTATWVYLEFVDEGNLILEPNLYWAGIEIYTGSVDYRFMIGDDTRAPKQPIDGGLVYLNDDTPGWAATGSNYAIDLAINAGNTYDLTFNVDMSNYDAFDASTETVSVTGSFGDAAVEMTTTDDVNYTVTVDANSATHNYKYSTTNNVEEFDRYKTLGIMDISVNDIYVPGPNTIDDNRLDLVSMYPNPFSGNLTIENLSNATQIVVSNVLGQTVITVPVTNNDMNISTESLEKGIYMITIIDSNNNKRTERMVKN